jgi:hypothetical protein
LPALRQALPPAASLTAGASPRPSRPVPQDQLPHHSRRQADQEDPVRPADLGHQPGREGYCRALRRRPLLHRSRAAAEPPMPCTTCMHVDLCPCLPARNRRSTRTPPPPCVCTSVTSRPPVVPSPGRGPPWW